MCFSINVGGLYCALLLKQMVYIVVYFGSRQYILCGREALIMRRPWLTRGCCDMEKMYILCFIVKVSGVYCVLLK